MKEQENFNGLVAFIEQDLIGKYINKEIDEYKRLSKHARIKYNWVTTCTVILATSVPVVAISEDAVAIAIVSGLAAILGTLSYSFNFKFEWQTHLVSLTYHKGILSEFQFELKKIELEDTDYVIKIEKLKEKCTYFLKKFNAYEHLEIITYFKQLGDIQNMTKSD